MTGRPRSDLMIGRGSVEINISRKITKLHPVAEAIAKNLAEVHPIRVVRVLPDLLEASSETMSGRASIPICEPGHPSAIGISIILSLTRREVQFYAITSAVKGYGGKMAEAVLRALPPGWRAVVSMDWSDGFWEHMSRKHTNLEIL